MYAGWNSASNSEGGRGEGVVAGEGQGRDGDLCAYVSFLLCWRLLNLPTNSIPTIFVAYFFPLSLLSPTLPHSLLILDLSEDASQPQHSPPHSTGNGSGNDPSHPILLSSFTNTHPHVSPTRS